MFLNKSLVLVLGMLVTLVGFSNEIRVFDSAQKTVSEMTIYAHRNEVVFFQTVMPEAVRASIIQGDTCAIEKPLRRLAGKNLLTTEARIVPYTMGNFASPICTVLFTDGTYKTTVKILYR